MDNLEGRPPSVNTNTVKNRRGFFAQAAEDHSERIPENVLDQFIRSQAKSLMEIFSDNPQSQGSSEAMAISIAGALTQPRATEASAANADPIWGQPLNPLGAPKKRPFSFSRRNFGKALFGAGLFAASFAGDRGGINLLNILRKEKVKKVQFNPSSMLKPMNLPTPAPAATEAAPTVQPVPTELPSPTPAPTPEPEQVPSRPEAVGESNLPEFLLGSMLEDVFKPERRRRYAEDPAFRERVKKEFVGSDNLFFVYTGIDETRERYNEFNGNGRGKSDIIMLIGFNPHTCKTFALSIPRDLFCPELKQYIEEYKREGDPAFADGARINTLGMIHPEDYDSLDMIRKVVETATSIPVDGVVKTNIDFMQGWNEELESPGGKQGRWHPGIFDRVFPGGLKVKSSRDEFDPSYPNGYGTMPVEFKKGEQTLDGVRLTQWARLRKSEGANDFTRSEKQRHILMQAMTNLFPRISADLLVGNTQTLDLIITALYEQRKLGPKGSENNLFATFQLPEMIASIRSGLVELRKQKNWKSVIGALLANTSGDAIELNGGVNNPLKLSSKAFSSYGISREDGTLINLKPGEVPGDFYKDFILRPSQADPNAPPTALGNYIPYYQQIRSIVPGLIKELQ